MRSGRLGAWVLGVPLAPVEVPEELRVVVGPDRPPLGRPPAAAVVAAPAHAAPLDRADEQVHRQRHEGCDEEELQHPSSLGRGPTRPGSGAPSSAHYAGGVKEFAVYTGLRLALFVASYAVVLGVWSLVSGDDAVPVLMPLVLAFLLSGLASWFLLDRQRQAFARRVQERAERASARLEQRRAEEDRDD